MDASCAARPPRCGSTVALGLQDKIQIVFIDTFFLFEETIAFMKEARTGPRARCREITRDTARYREPS